MQEKACSLQANRTSHRTDESTTRPPTSSSPAPSLFSQFRHSSDKSKPPSMKRCLFLLLVLLGLGGQNRAIAQMTAADVQLVINQAISRAVAISPNSVIAVTDREG